MASSRDQPTVAAHRSRDSVVTMILVPIVVGAAVAVALGVYGRVHEPTGVAINVAGFSGAQAAKSWLATGAFLLAGIQLVSAQAMWGCFFFGAFTAKMLLLTRRGLPNWVIPLIGGLVFSALVGLWLTSSFWFFTTVGVTL